MRRIINYVKAHYASIDIVTLIFTALCIAILILA
jgi:hypothetical protein